MLKITNYVLGDDFTTNNFVSFTYGGSNLFAAYTIASPDVGSFDGSFNGSAGPQNISIFGPFDINGSPYFQTFLDGSWDTGILFSSDMGNGATWAIAGVQGGVPEPATWAMLIIGFGAVGMASRKRRTRAVFA